MNSQTKLLLFLLLFTASGAARAQKIDAFHIDRSVSPQALFVRLHFPDSGYYVARTFNRVAFIYPPVNLVTFFYRSCDFVKASPIRDTTIFIYTPEPYGLRLFLVKDSNTVTSGCAYAGETETVDSGSYRSESTGINDHGPGINHLHIFPNPATGILHVAGAHGCELLISDETGRLQLRQKAAKRTGDGKYQYTRSRTLLYSLLQGWSAAAELLFQ